MSLGDIGAFLGGVGSLFGARSQDKANQRTEAANQEFQNKLLARQDAGTVDPFGTRVGREGDGPLKTTLAGPVKEAADIGAQNVLGQETAKLPAVERGGRLLGEISNRLPAPREAINLDQARGIVGADNDRIKNAILNPALDDASMLASRTRRGMSNQPALVSRFMERIAPQLQLGGEQKAMELEQWDRNRLGSELNTAQALMMDPRFAPTIPGTSSIGEIAQAGAMVPKPQPISPSYTGSMGLMGVSNALNQMQNTEDMRVARDKHNALMTQLVRQLGDQGPSVGYHHLNTG